MIDYVFPPPHQASAAVAGRPERFPVRRIYCVGRNYVAHRAEMGGDDREPPFFFAKPTDALTASGATMAFPRATQNLHHEIELVIAIGRSGVDIAQDAASEHIFGYAVGVDLTRRDLQAAAKAKGQPWEAAKAFDQSAPMGPITPWSGAPPSGTIALQVNGQTRQSARLTDMIWNVAEIVSEASRLWRLEAGDLIFTGTPEGVGPLHPGDWVEGLIEGLDGVRFGFAPTAAGTASEGTASK